MACKKNFANLVRCLLKRCANPNILTNEFRKSPLHYAVQNNAEACIKALIEYNSDVEASGNRIASKICLNDKKSKELVRCLVSDDLFLDNAEETRLLCNFNSRDIDGETPISLALNQGFNHLVPVLIQVGSCVKTVL